MIHFLKKLFKPNANFFVGDRIMFKSNVKPGKYAMWLDNYVDPLYVYQITSRDTVYISRFRNKKSGVSVPVRDIELYRKPNSEDDE